MNSIQRVSGYKETCYLSEIKSYIPLINPANLSFLKSWVSTLLQTLMDLYSHLSISVPNYLVLLFYSYINKCSIWLEWTSEYLE